MSFWAKCSRICAKFWVFEQYEWEFKWNVCDFERNVWDLEQTVGAVEQIGRYFKQIVLKLIDRDFKQTVWDFEQNIQNSSKNQNDPYFEQNC